MKLILGLGNIGEKYKLTRHNIGFMVLDKYASLINRSWTKDKHFEYISYSHAVLIKPNTFMNLSGLALKEAMNRWSSTDVLVIYDDLELDIADLRFRSGGGDGGHNGIKSLLEVIPATELKRVRIGIGKNANQRSEHYVLANIPEPDRKPLDGAIDTLCTFLKVYIARDFSSMLDEYSKWKKTYSGKSETGIISPKED